MEFISALEKHREEYIVLYRFYFIVLAGLTALSVSACGGELIIQQVEPDPNPGCILEEILDQAESDTKAVIIMGKREFHTLELRAMAEAFGGTVYRNHFSINAVAARFVADDLLLADIAADPMVRAVVPDDRVYALHADDDCSWWFPDDKRGEFVPWGVARHGASMMWSRTKGDRVRVAVIDTGIDVDHPDLLGNLAGGINLITSGDYTLDEWNDDHGHGTHVAGTIGALHDGFGVVGMAPEVQLVAVKVLNKYGSGSVSNIVSALEWVVDNNIHVVNMSLGSSTENLAFKEACDAATAAGVLIVAAAGNSGDGDPETDNVGYPAQFDSVMAVGAVNESDVVTSFSSDGPAVEISAHGKNVVSDWKFGTLRRLSGTSMASPHVAGAAALLFARYPGVATNVCVRQALVASAEDLGDPGRDPFYGAGLVDVLAAEAIMQETCAQ